MDFHDIKQREKIDAMIQKKGTLVAYFKLYYATYRDRSGVYYPAVSLVHWRADMPVFDMYRYIGWPQAIPVDADEASIVSSLRDYIKSKIRY